MMDGGFSRRMSGDRLRCGPSVSVFFQMVPMVLCPASHRRVLEESLIDRNLVEVRDALLSGKLRADRLQLEVASSLYI